MTVIKLANEGFVGSAAGVNQQQHLVHLRFTAEMETKRLIGT